jgi:hypothetical protein
MKVQQLIVKRTVLESLSTLEVVRQFFIFLCVIFWLYLVVIRLFLCLLKNIFIIKLRTFLSVSVTFAVLICTVH